MYEQGQQSAATGIGSGAMLQRGGGYGPSEAPAPTQRPTVTDAIATNEQLLGDLHQTISALTEHLSMILGPQPPSTNGEAAKQPNAPNVLERLSMHGLAIRMATSRLSELIQRVQL